MSSTRAIDPDDPATTSSKVIGEIVRGEIGFDGLLISDDTSMKALSGDFPTKAAAILAAGCDIVLHCNGVMEEMRGIAVAHRRCLRARRWSGPSARWRYIRTATTADEADDPRRIRRLFRGRCLIGKEIGDKQWQS